MKNSKKNKFHISYFKFHNQQGFTLMEIIVATTIFAIVAVSMLSLFNYVLKINRRSQALAQASDGMRDFVEFLVKEIRNGQIDYNVSNGVYTAAISPSSPCQPPGAVGTSGGIATPSSYLSQDNKLEIINTDNLQECFYYGDSNGKYLGSNIFSSSTGASLDMQEQGVTQTQILNSPNFKIDNLMFLIRPLCDPYSDCAAYGDFYPKLQPAVTIIIKFIAQLPTGEQVPIYYQTSVSSNKYDIPSH